MSQPVIKTLPLSELISFVKDVSQFGVVSVTKKHCSTSLVKEVELHAHIPQESKLGVTPQLKRKVTVNFSTKDKGSVSITGCDILPDGCITRMARRFMVKSVPQHLWPISTVFVMVHQN
jgi:hypothetical protein